MKAKVLIAEDERLAREELIYQLQQEEDFLVCPSAENGKQLLDLYEKYEPQVIFLDVEMPILSGIQAAKQIAETCHELKKSLPLFVFITAYEEYAVEAFGIEAVDYLLKPYGSTRLRQAIERLRKHLKEPVTTVQPPSKLLIEDGEKLVVLQPEDIYYASRMDRFIEIFTKDDRVQTKMTLNELEEKVTGFSFLRPHRSYLVNLNYIQEIVPWFNGAYNLILKDKRDVRIPVSRSAAKILFERLQH